MRDLLQQRLPRSGPARERLREKGQFWTPPWVARAMVAYALGGGAREIFDPAVGAGAFFLAARALARETGRQVALTGTEVDAGVLAEARRAGLSEADLAGVEIGDFVLAPPVRSYDAIVANPPYIRHHRLSASVKEALRFISLQIIGTALDGRAGYHVYFLIRALSLLKDGGRLAFIVPADVCEGRFAPALWSWIARHYRLDAIITFTPEATPFPGVDVNPLVIMLSKQPPESHFYWARCTTPGEPELEEWCLSGFSRYPQRLQVWRRALAEGLATGLSRPPAQASPSPVLGDFARVMRGIATGANWFFLLTASRAAELEIPAEFLLPAVARTRDVHGDELREDDLAVLDAKGRPTRLLALDGRPKEFLPQVLRDYLDMGERAGLPLRPLIRTRRCWYRMERRAPPPFLFAYLGRRNARFIRNLAGAVPLTGFLCVYPRRQDPVFLDALWRVLKHPETLRNLAAVGKSYGSGAIKVEPRALEKLPLPAQLVREAGLVALAGAGAGAGLPRQEAFPVEICI